MTTRYKNTSLKNLQYRLRRYKDVVHEELFDIIRSKEDVIKDYVRKQQLYNRGIYGTGQRIWETHPYAASTIERKRRKGQITTRVTLRDTGKFYDEFDVVITADGFYVESKVDYGIYIERRYGNNIYRLTNENLNKLLNKHIRPELTKRLKKRLLHG